MKLRLTIAVVGLVFMTCLLSAHAQSPSVILVWKVIVADDLGEGVRRCPVCKAMLPEGVVKRNDADVMKRYLKAGLSKMRDCRFIYVTTKKAKSEDEAKKHDLDRMLAVTKEEGADALLATVLLRFKELVGSKYAASEPASVTFHLHMVRVIDSRPIWDFVYSETQRPLSDNVLEAKKLWKRRFAWVRAEKLLSEGVDKAMRSFPRCRVHKP